MKPPLRLALVALAVAAAACGDEYIITPQQYATVRLVNAVGVDTLGLLRSDLDIPVTWARYRMGSDCLVLPAGEQTLRFRQLRSTTNIATADHDFQTDGRYTIVVTGTEADAQTTVLRDEYTPPSATNNLVRFVNATGTAGDIYANPAGETPGTPVVAGLEPIGATGEPSDWITLPKTDTQIRLYAPGTTTTPRATFNLTVPAAGVTTVVFFDAATPPAATGVRIDPCA